MGELSCWIEYAAQREGWIVNGTARELYGTDEGAVKY